MEKVVRPRKLEKKVGKRPKVHRDYVTESEKEQSLVNFIAEPSKANIQRMRRSYSVKKQQLAGTQQE